MNKVLLLEVNKDNAYFANKAKVQMEQERQVIDKLRYLWWNGMTHIKRV